MLLAALLGWLEREQRDVIAFLREENRVLKTQLAGRRPRFTNPQRRRLAQLGQRLGRAVLRDVATLVTPDTSSMASRTDCAEVDVLSEVSGRPPGARFAARIGPPSSRPTSSPLQSGRLAG